MKKLKQTNKKIQIILALLVLVAANMAFLPKVFATTYLTKTSLIFTNMNSGGASSLIVEFTTSASNTGTNGQIVFSGWTGSAGTGTVATSQAVANTFGPGSTDCETITGATAHLPGSPTAAGTAGTGTIAITDATALAISTSYCYVLTSAITANPTSTGQGTATVTAGADAASNVAFDIISNDQVVVNATVPPSYTLALSGNTDNFSPLALSTGSIGSTTGITATVNTNAQNGWYLWGLDANTGLKSTTQSYTVASKTPGSNATLTAGTEGYVTGLPAAGITQGSGAGTTSAITAYASSGSGNGSGLDTAERQIAKSTGTANGAIVTIKEYAAISGVTPAALDYSDTITLVGAGSF